MIGVVDVKVNAANPNFPLDPVFTFKDSPQSFRVRNVPRKIGAWAISQVFVNVAYPDNSTIVQECLLIGGVWVGTVGGCSTTGSVKQGFVVTANGTDENGNSVNGYVLGVGDIFVKDFDGTITPGTSAARMFFYESVPATPKEGDACFQNGVFTVWDGSSWQSSDVPHDDQKLDGAAAYPAWDETHQYEDNDTVSYGGRIWFADGTPTLGFPPGEDAAWNETSIGTYLSLKQNALSDTQLANIAAVPGKADKAVPSAAGNLASLNAQGDLADSGVKPSDFAAPSDLPYALVEPGKWEFSDGDYEISGPNQDGDVWKYTAGIADSQAFSTEAEALSALVLYFVHEPSGTSFTATRASLPGHLLDRAGNRVVVSGDTTLTLPALEHAGRLRDFLVRLEISGSTVPTIMFAASGNESLTYETDGDEFPVPDEVGNWVYSFTENCVAHTFAVSLKKVNTVAQGGV